MRLAFVQELERIANDDPRIVLLTGDLGFGALESFAQHHPARFFNAGVAEQNMVAIATGLAQSGFIPFVYSIASFVTMRPYEFIRNGPALHALPVRIIGIGSGFDYGFLGATHYSLEDVAIMRAQPRMTVVAPADHEQARAALAATWDLRGPIYYRLGRDENVVVPGLQGRFELGRLVLVRDGSEALVLATGNVAAQAVAAADDLALRHVHVAVAVVASISPAPEDDLVALLPRFRSVLTVEAHYIVGGLGSLAAEVIAEHGIPTVLTRVGVRTSPSARVGTPMHMLADHQIDAHGIARQLLASLGLDA